MSGTSIVAKFSMSLKDCFENVNIIKYLEMYKVQIHAGAISKLLYVFLRLYGR